MRWIGLALAVLSAAPAWAQDSPRSGRDDDIIVTGQRIDREQARRLVNRLASPVDGQLARFLTPICPAMIGFDDQHNELVERRMRTFAREMGLPVKDAPCAGNLIVVVTDDADATVERWHRKRSPLFRGVREEAMADALAPGPVHSWSATLVLNEDRQQIKDSGSQYKIESCGPGCTKFNSVLDVKSASIIQRPTQWVYLSSIVVIDRNAALGKTLKQIADYASMRMLTGARPPSGDEVSNSILTLFNDQDAPQQATSIDRSFVRGLYRSSPRARSSTASATIATQIAKDSEAAATASD